MGYLILSAFGKLKVAGFSHGLVSCSFHHSQIYFYEFHFNEKTANIVQLLFVILSENYCL